MKRIFLLAYLCLFSSILFSQTMLDSVLVTASRASTKTPVAFTTIGKDAIRLANIAADIPSVIALSPSVVATSEGGLGVGNTSFRIRGVDPSRINITVDGVVVNDAESQTVYWANMPDFGSTAGSIQVQRGVGISTPGTASFGSSVRMLTARPRAEAYSEFSTEYGSYNTTRTSIAVGTGLVRNAFTFDARYSYIRSDGYIERSNSNSQSVFASAAYHGSKQLLKLSVLYGNQHTGISWSGVPGYMLKENRRYNPAGKYVDNDGKTSYYDNETDSYKQAQLSLLYTQELGSRWTASIKPYLTRGLGCYEEYKENRKLKDYGIADFLIGNELVLRSDLIRQKWLSNYYYGAMANIMYALPNVQLVLGLDAARYDGDHYGKLTWLRVNNGVLKNHEWYRNNGLKDDASAFLRASYGLNSKLNLFADVQYRYVGYVMAGADDDLKSLNQSHYFGFFNPKLGANYELSKHHSFYASLATIGREPARADFKDASKDGGRAIPSSERLFDFELGYHYSSPHLSFSANLYHMLYKDQIIATGKLNAVGHPVMENVPASYRTGVELVASCDFSSQLQLSANLTLSRNKIRDYICYVDLVDNSTLWTPMGQRKDELGNVDISFSPSVIGASLLSYKPTPQLLFSLSGKYVSKQYYDNTMSSNRMLDAYFISGLNAQYAFSLKQAKLAIMASINNLFNKQYISSAWVYRSSFTSGEPDYIEDGFFPQAGRTFFTKLVITF